MSNGIIICCVGETGSGKTTWIKQQTNKAPDKEILIYLRMKDDFTGKKVKKFRNFRQFIDVANQKQNSFQLIDEAFTALPKELKVNWNKPDSFEIKLADFFVNTRKMNNFCCINFHSLEQVPLWLITYLDFFNRFTTNDALQYQISRFRSFPTIHNDLKQFQKIEKYKPHLLKIR